MAELVSVVALSHAPGLTGWLDQAPEAQRRSLTDGFRGLGEALRASRPDVIVGLANDHVLNMPPWDVRDFCVGAAAAWTGPAEWFREWVAVPDYAVAGRPDVAERLREGLAGRGFDVVAEDELLFDDNWSVPLHYLTPGHDIPLVPIHMNCVVPPVPSPETCRAFGEAVAEIAASALPEGMRIAFMATGGLSHDPGGPKYFQVDEAFDRWFLDLMAAGDPERVVRECTVEKMVAAGDGGTTELLAWIAAMGAAGGRAARVVCYEPAVELRCGMGCVRWDMAREPARA